MLRLKDTFIHHSHLCLVFELLSNNLYELIKQNSFRGLSTSLVRVFTAQLLDALTVLQEAKIIHCDLKPENILLKSCVLLLPFQRETPRSRKLDLAGSNRQRSKSLISGRRATRSRRSTRTSSPGSIEAQRSSSRYRTRPQSTCGPLDASASSSSSAYRCSQGRPSSTRSRGSSRCSGAFPLSLSVVRSVARANGRC